MKRSVLFHGILMIALLVTGGCTTSLSESTAEELITRHFEKRQYKVTELTIGDINPVPMGEKQYMGTAGYRVSVPLLTLEFTRDIGDPWNYTKGQRKTFRNARVKIKERSGHNREWIIADIEGVPLP